MRIIRRIGVALLAIAALALVVDPALRKVDYRHINERAGWQLPDRIIASLQIAPGSHVADLGAGDGYFVPWLADSVGGSGRVFAVDIDEDAIRALEELARRNGRRNIIVVRGRPDDPQLPEGDVDLIFVCNVYHHIADRPQYFARLRTDLRPNARVAIVEPRADQLSVVSLLQFVGHATSRQALLREMSDAGYRSVSSFDFLPLQHFEVFAAISVTPTDAAIQRRDAPIITGPAVRK